MINRVGIFGGSFNPITKMHIKVVQSAILKCHLNTVFYEPVGNRYELKNLVTVDDRLKMIQMAINEYEFANNSVVELGCIDAYSPKSLFTYELLDRYIKMFINYDLYFICGSDNLKDINNWKNPDRIFELSRLIVHQRSGHDINEIISGSSLLSKNSDRIIPITHFNNNLSSTMVRGWIRSGINIDKRYMSKLVMEYIENHKLYLGLIK